MDKSYRDPDYEITNDDCVRVCVCVLQCLGQNNSVAFVWCQTPDALQPNQKLYRT